jgi:hypothetical protein
MTKFARRALQATAALGVLAFWAGTLTAARRFPSEYDWRYMTLSSLLYPERNPAGHLWASTGIVVCGCCGLGWAGALAREAGRRGAQARPIGIWALCLGYFFMGCCALLPERLLAVPRGHEILALLAFFGLCFGMVQLTFLTVEHSLQRRATPPSDARRLYAAVLAGAALSPVLLTACVQAYVTYALPELPWVSLTWRARGVPMYLSFALWQWITCLIFSAYMIVLSQATLARTSRPGRSPP